MKNQTLIQIIIKKPFHYQDFKLLKIHRVLDFKQKGIPKPYIECNTELQRKAEKEGYRVKTKTNNKKQNAKLRNNAIFGKSIENPMNKYKLRPLENNT